VFALSFASCKKESEPKPVPVPIADFLIIGNNEPAPAKISFTNESQNAEAFYWEFGDGGISTENNPNHTYQNAGAFNVKLTATGEGGVHSVSKSIIVGEPIPDPVPNFSILGDNNFAPCKVNFTNTSTNSLTYTWDFGDGGTSSAKSPEHVYLKGGAYNVTLKAKNSIGVEKIINKAVTIKDTPSKVKITALRLTGYPLTRADGTGWDPSSGPDIYMKFTDDAGTNFFTTSYYSDVIKTDLPLNFTDGFPLIINDIDYKLIISCYDYESFGSDEVMAGFYFTARNWMPTNGDAYPTELTFQSQTSDLKFTLEVEWLQ